MNRNLTRTYPRARNAAEARGSSLLATIVVTLVVAVFLAAGFWQLHRAHYKDELRIRADAAMRDAAIEMPATLVSNNDLEFRAVHVQGQWLAEKSILIDNKILNGVVGYEVVTPLRIGVSSMHVLVNRGWIAAPPLRSDLPEFATPPGPVEISGIARTPSNRFLELSSQVEQGRVWQNLTIERFQKWANISLQPTVIYQQNASNDKLVRVSVAPEASGLNADRHRGYALTWFGLAIVTIGLAVAAKIQAKNRHEQKT